MARRRSRDRLGRLPTDPTPARIRRLARLIKQEHLAAMRQRWGGPDMRLLEREVRVVRLADVVSA